MPRTFLILFLFACIFAAPACSAEPGSLALDSLPNAGYRFSGDVGERVNVNVEQWLLPAPYANPGMVEMFRMRDRKPVPKFVPWAGEFVGKYLISAIQALRMTDNPRLAERVKHVVGSFISTQSEDGYLGPFPKEERLLKHWDLWGHYHALLALTMWHEQTGNPKALAAARKAADLICSIYLDGGRRVFDAGDHEMNMATLTGMAMLHRLTGEPRYLRMAREVEKDWERAGDYLRAGLDGREFYRTPRPRWESLHCLQGLVEMWRITGDDRYRQAFEHQWRSILRWDRRNTGGFSSGEQATGNPYEPTAIETCCTVAWMALTLDYLRLTGDVLAADELELSTLNGGLGAQHPSGRWWTYNTPMDGVREASAHSIVFQSRAGTPELNCCSVNGPRVLGMLSEWAVMSDGNALVINWLGAGEYRAKLKDGTEVQITSSADIWHTGETRFRIEAPMELTIRIRIPRWTRNPNLLLNDRSVGKVVPGSYHEIRRKFSKKDRLEFLCSIPMQAVAGARHAEGKVSIYHGPILMAYDQGANSFDEDSIPPIDVARLSEARLAVPMPSWLAARVPTDGQTPMYLVDYAMAGGRGTRYRTWLEPKIPLPAPAFTTVPRDGARLGSGRLYFRWRPGGRKSVQGYRAEFSTDRNFASDVWSMDATEPKLDIETSVIVLKTVNPDSRIYWRVATKGEHGETVPVIPAAWFILDPKEPAQPMPAELALGPKGELVSHAFRDRKEPELGKVESLQFSALDTEGIEFNGRNQRAIFTLPSWPEEDYSVTVRVRINEMPGDRLGQIFSAWTAPGDDPLRIVVDRGKLHARIEAGSAHSTPGVEIKTGEWHAVAAVKQGATLTLYLDGKSVGSTAAPIASNTQSTACALGGNPRFQGNEFLAARISDFKLYAKALDAKEISAAAGVAK